MSLTEDEIQLHREFQDETEEFVRYLELRVFGDKKTAEAIFRIADDFMRDLGQVIANMEGGLSE